MKKLEQHIPARATAVDGQTTVGEAPHKSRVIGVSFIPDAAVVGADVNTRRLSLVNRGQGGAGNVEIAFLALAAGVNISENDERAFTLHATHANRNVEKGDVLEIVSDAQGSGLADPGGLIQVEIR
jgi:hypothetical protein